MLCVVPSTILDWQMKRRKELSLSVCADAGSSSRKRESECAIKGEKGNHLGLSDGFCDRQNSKKRHSSSLSEGELKKFEPVTCIAS